MARTTTMRLIELMVLREDIHSVLKYLGELGEFQFQQEFASDSSDSAKRLNPDASVFERLQQVRAALDLPDLDGYKVSVPLPSGADFFKATKNSYYKEAQSLTSIPKHNSKKNRKEQSHKRSRINSSIQRRAIAENHALKV